MSVTHYLHERAKYNYILQLSKEQVKAIESDDMARLHKILKAKGVIIKSLKNGSQLIQSDGSMISVVNAIKASEQYAEKLLYQRFGEIKKKMHELRQSTAATSAYRKSTRRLPSFVPSTETPRMFDLRS